MSSAGIPAELLAWCCRLEGVSGSLRKELRPLGITVMTVEPDAFRTDFADRSLSQSAAAIAYYADTAGSRRIENAADHGKHPGTRTRPPRHDHRAGLAAWNKLSESTDLDR